MTSIVALLWSLVAAATGPLEFPASLVTRSLSEHVLRIPQDLPTAPTLLVIGFTKASRSQTAKWPSRLAADEALSRLAVYRVAVLEDVPAFVRGFIVDGMRRDVPKPMHDTFLIATEGAVEWKAAVSFGREDDAYVLLLSADHRIVWRDHGEPSDDSIGALRGRVGVSEARPWSQ